MSENSATTHSLAPTSTGPAAKRKTNPDLQQLLKQYAAAALGVAGVSALSPAQSTARHILYTPANITVDTGVLRSTSVPLDLNHDGITDLTIMASHFRD